MDFLAGFYGQALHYLVSNKLVECVPNRIDRLDITK